MSNEPCGWVRIRTMKEKVKSSVENIVEKWSPPPSPAEIQTTWTELRQCIPRGGSFVVYFEQQCGSKRERFDLTINPEHKEDGGHYSIKPSLNRTGKIVDLREKPPFSGFIRYFEFETVSLSGESLFWQMGIMKLPPETSADLEDGTL